MRLRGRDRRPVARGPVITVGHDDAGVGQLGHERGVRLVPVRPLPAARLEADRTELLLTDVERGRPQRPEHLGRLQRVQDVVDLDEAPDTALLHELGRELHVLEAVQVALVHIGAGASLDHPLGHRTRDAGAVRHPHGLRDPEAGQVAVLTHDRGAVGSEGEDAVEALLHLVVPQDGQQVGGVLPRLGEVLLGEGEHRRHRAVVVPQPLDADRHRPVAVGADPDPVAMLAVVEVGILVAQDRLARLPRRVVHQARHLPGLGVLVRHRQQRHRQPHHLADLRAPEPGAGHDEVRRDHALVGDDTGDAATLTRDVDDGVLAEETSAPLHRPPSLRLTSAQRLGQTVARDVQAPQDLVRVHQRVQPRALLRVDQPRSLDAPRLRVAVPAVQLSPALRGRRDLQAADGVEAPGPVQRQVRELAHRVLRQLGHRLAGIGLEDQSRRVRARPAGGEQRSLVEHGDVGPTAFGQLVGQRAPDDAGADDHDTWRGSHGSSS